MEAMDSETRPRRYPRSHAYVLAVQWEKGKITDAQFVDGLTEQLIELELSTRFRLPFAQVAMLIQQACRTPDEICKHLLPRCLALLSRMGPAPLINYNRLITFLSKKGDLQAVLMVYKRMKEHKVAPDRLTLSALLGACSKGGNVDAAFRLFQGMVEQGIVPNTTNYNGLIGACSKNKKLDLGLSTYAEMKARGLPSDFHTFNVLIELTTGCDRPELAVRFFEEMVTEHAEMVDNASASLLAHVIRECAKAGKLADALRVFDLACTRTRLKPDLIALSSLVNACGLAGDVDRALKVFKDMESVHKVTPNIVTYGGLIRALATHNRLEEAVQMHKDMVGRGIAPNATTYQCLLKGAANEGRVDLALATLQEMEQKGIPFNPTTLPIFVNILVGNNQGSHTQAAKEMDKSDMLATTEVPVDRHRLAQALEMADTFDKKYNLWLDRSALQTLLRACVQAEQWPQAKQLVARAHQRRVNVNAPLLTLINAH